MAKLKNASVWCVLSLTVLLLILDNKAITYAAAESVEICLRSVVPALFPFLFLSNITISKLSAVSAPALRPLGRFCRIPIGTEIIFLMGVLGGYPIGAQCISRAYEAGNLDRQNAQRMLGFCNYCGPGFLFGILGAYFDDLRLLILLWFIHILSGIITARLLPQSTPGMGNATTVPASIKQAMKQSLLAMAQVCGWIILFRIIINTIQRWAGFLIDDRWGVVLFGALELTNGCLMLNQISSTELRLIAASFMMGFGGLCVAMQTRAVVSEDLRLKYYLPGKVLHCLISTLLCSIFFLRNISMAVPAICAVALAFTLIFCRIFFVTSRNLQPQGV